MAPKIVGGDKAHATFSASGSARWLNCPGSIALSAKAPEQRESEYAAEGTLAHECLEYLLKNRIDLTAARKAALRDYPAAMVEHATTAVDWVLGEPEGILLCETKVDASPFTCAGQFGTLDIAIVREFGRLTVVDYKYGAGIIVDPGYDGTGNSQLVYYALGVSHMYDHNFSEVELVIIQPRGYTEDGETVRRFVMPMEALLAWEPKFQAGVKAAQAPKAALTSGSWCRFCPAAVTCPEFKDRALKQAQVVFSDNKVQSVPEPTMIKLPDLGTILDACDRLEDWIGKVREHAVHVLERGHEVAGFKLVAKRSPRKWVDVEKISKEAAGKFGVGAFTEPELLSPAQLEKAQKGAKGLDAWISARTSSESSGTTLVRETDKRPAVKPIESVFGAPAALPPSAKNFPLALQGKIPNVGKRGIK